MYISNPPRQLFFVRETPGLHGHDKLNGPGKDKLVDIAVHEVLVRTAGSQEKISTNQHLNTGLIVILGVLSHVFKSYHHLTKHKYKKSNLSLTEL